MIAQGFHRRSLLAASLALTGAAASAAHAGPRPGRSGYVSSDGLPVYFEDHGVAEDPVPLVLLHGGLLAIETAFSEDLLPRLARTRRVIAIEQQGHGHTADREGPLTLEHMVADTVAVLSGLGVGRADFLGHSLGGMIAVEAAIHRPALVRGLIALSVGSSNSATLPELRMLQSDPSHAPSADLQARLPTPDEFTAWQSHYQRVAPRPEAFPEVMGKLMRLIADWRGWTATELAGIRSPTLLALGDRDFVTPGAVAGMADQMPDARLAVLPGTTHMSILRRGAWIEAMLAEVLPPAP